MIQTLKFKTKSRWLEQRLEDVTSSQVPILFGVRPYPNSPTLQELWYEKRHKYLKPVEETNAMSWGKANENLVAYGLAGERGWVITPKKEYLRDPIRRAGSSFDFYERRNQALLEIKCVGYWAFRNKWRGWGLSAQAPPHIELQCQFEMMISETPRLMLGVGVGDPDDKDYVLPPPEKFYCLREADYDVWEQFDLKLRLFWESVESGVCPLGKWIGDYPILPKTCALPVVKKREADLFPKVLAGW